MHEEHPPAKVLIMINICFTVAENRYNKQNKYSSTVVCSMSFSSILLKANQLLKPFAVIFRYLCTMFSAAIKQLF